MPHTMLRFPTVKARTGLSRSTIYLRISRGTFPAPVSLGGRAVGWIEAEVHAWLTARVAQRRQIAPAERGSATPAPGSRRRRATFTLSAYVRNLARVFEATSEATTLRWYSSTDATISASDTEIGTDAVPALGPRGSSLESVELTAPSAAGTHYYGACVDAVARESNTGNNCSRSVPIFVTEYCQTGGRGRPRREHHPPTHDGTAGGRHAARLTRRATGRRHGRAAAARSGRPSRAGTPHLRACRAICILKGHVNL